MNIKVLMPFASTIAIFCFCAIAQPAAAQTPAARPTTKASVPPTDVERKAIQRRVEEWLKACLANWEKDTHMTRAEWRATCQRVASERGKVLIEDRAQRRSK